MTRVPRVGRRAVLVGAGALAGLGAAPSGALRGPVDVAGRRARVGHPLGAPTCAVPVAPQTDIHLDGFYRDKSFSVVDPARQRAYQDSAKAFNEFSVTVARQSDLWLASRPAAPAAAACGLAWLDHWADNGAMLSNVSKPDGEHERKWALAGSALAYLKLRSAPDLDRGAQTRVEAWFGRLADASTAYYATWRRASYNNHIWWLALALAATAVARDDRAMLARAVEFYRIALDDIAPDGTLPLEMGRKGRALSYHVFSLAPLVMLAEIGHANGMDLYAARDGALHRLAKKVREGLLDPASFAPEQEEAGPANMRRNLMWAEPYQARFPDRDLARLLAGQRPIFYHWLGGDLTADFASS